MTNDDYDLDFLLYGGLPPGPLDNEREGHNNNYNYNSASCNECIHSQPDDYGRLWCSVFGEYLESEDAQGCKYYE